MSIAKLTLELDELKDSRAKAEKGYNLVNGRFRSGAIALLVGLVLFFVTNGVIAWIGVFLVLIGLLAALTNLGKRGRLKKELEAIDKAVSMKRAQIANSPG